MFVVAKVDINYIKPARFNDQLSIETIVDKIGASKINLTQDIYKNSDLCTSAKVNIACLNLIILNQRIPNLLTKNGDIMTIGSDLSFFSLIWDASLPVQAVMLILVIASMVSWKIIYILRLRLLKAEQKYG